MATVKEVRVILIKFLPKQSSGYGFTTSFQEMLMMITVEPDLQINTQSFCTTNNNRLN